MREAKRIREQHRGMERGRGRDAPNRDRDIEREREMDVPNKNSCWSLAGGT